MEGTHNLTLNETFTCGKWDLTEDEEKIKDDHSWWVGGLASMTMGFFGLVINTILIAVLSSQEFKNIFFNKLIISHTISDILFLACSTYQSLKFDFLKTGYCGLHGYLHVILFPLRKIFMCFSIYMMVVLTFERYLAVTTPISHRIRSIGSSCTKRIVKYISPVFIVSFVLFGTPLFFAFKIDSFPNSQKTNVTTNSSNNSVYSDEEDNMKYCMSIWLRMDKDYVFWYYNLTNFVITGAIPFALLLILNCKSYLAIQHSARNQHKLNKRRHSTIPVEYEKAQEKNKDILQSMVLFGLVISFFVCHILRIVLNLEEIINFEERNHIAKMEIKFGVTCTVFQFWALIASDISHFLLVVNSSINFFIYGYVSSQFRKVLKEKMFTSTRLSTKYSSKQRRSYTQSLLKRQESEQYERNRTMSSDSTGDKTRRMSRYITADKKQFIESL